MNLGMRTCQGRLLGNPWRRCSIKLTVSQPVAHHAVTSWQTWHRGEERTQFHLLVRL